MHLLHNVTVVTMDKDRRIITDGAIAFENNTIRDVGKAESLLSAHKDAALEDGHEMLVLPGFIDAHAHADQSLLRGIGDQLHWIPFLDDVVDPFLTKGRPTEGVIANKLAMSEMLRNGTTCFVSPNVDPSDDFEQLTHAIGELGIRAILGRFTIPEPGEDSPAIAATTLENTMRVMNAWHESANGLVSLWFGLDVPRRPGDTDHPSFYRAVMNESKQLGVGIVYHFCSEFEDAIYMVNHYGMRPAEWSLANHALGENVLLIGGTQMTPKEIEILKDTGTHLAHSPVANMKMATGNLPLVDVLAAGVNVSLGTDGALNNNSYDMISEMKTAVLLQNSMCRNAKALGAHEVLEMATINGARAIGRENDLGSIEPGKQADLLMMNLSHPSTVPTHDLVSNIVFSAGVRNVHSVYVAGRKVVKNGRVTGLDEEQLVNQAREVAHDLVSRLKLTPTQLWPIE